MKSKIYAYGLSLCCILAPLLLAYGALGLTASMLMHRANELDHLPYEFLSTRDLPRAADGVEVKQVAASAVEVKHVDEKNEQNVAVAFLAKDLRGRALYAAGSAALYLASAAAIGFGFWVFGPGRLLIALGFLVAFGVLGYGIARSPVAFDLLRPLVVEYILAAAKDQAPPMSVLVSGDADRSLFNQIVGGLFPSVEQYRDPAVTGLVRLNSIIGLAGVGMLLAALACASVRRKKLADLASASVRREKQPAPDELEQIKKELESTHDELTLRLVILRIFLALGASVLVIAVLCSKILIEWPTSLLSNSQQKAIAPIGEALNLMFGASGTLGLIAALVPALAAFSLDRQLYRAELAKLRLPVLVEAIAQDQKPAQRDDLEFAPFASMSAVIAVLSPLLTSPLLGLITSFVKVSHS